MKRQEILYVLDKYTGAEISPVVAKAHRYAVNCVERIGYLKDRPCEACVFHDEDGCNKYDCVFDELIYERSKE